MKTILVTGVSGFIGQALCLFLHQKGYRVKGAIRTASAEADMPDFVTSVVIGEINALTDWKTALMGVDVVIHLAARVHVMQETVNDPLYAFRLVNTIGTENLARQAAKAGVNRFIFLSTIKVLGEGTLGKAFTADAIARPMDDYALSKWEAEQALQLISVTSNMPLVVIRPPLVYGPGVKGNFLRLMQLVKCGWPLPFASVCNKRSLVYVENLCDLIRVCIENPNALGQILLVADGQSLSTPELIAGLAKALATPARLWPVPVNVLKKLAGIFKKRAELDRLCDSMMVDASLTNRLLDWQPPFSVENALEKTVENFSSRVE